MTYLILALAAWRITSLLVNEAGPRDVLLKMRVLAGVVYGNDAYGTNTLAQLLVCPWCLSVWVGAVATIIYYFWPDLAFWLSLPFAISAIVILWEETIEKLE